MSEAESFPSRVDAGSGDELLSKLAGTTETGISMGILLVVPGAILTGTVVSRDTWFEGWTEEMEKTDGAAKAFAQAMSNIKDQLGIHVLDSEFTGKDLPTRIHLKDATIYANGTNFGPFLLRVRIDTVSAWTMGSAPNE